jgi:hypothetical protein
LVRPHPFLPGAIIGDDDFIVIDVCSTRTKNEIQCIWPVIGGDDDGDFHFLSAAFELLSHPSMATKPYLRKCPSCTGIGADRNARLKQGLHGGAVRITR